MLETTETLKENTIKALSLMDAEDLHEIQDSIEKNLHIVNPKPGMVFSGTGLIRDEDYEATIKSIDYMDDDTLYITFCMIAEKVKSFQEDVNKHSEAESESGFGKYLNEKLVNYKRVADTAYAKLSNKGLRDEDFNHLRD